MDPLSNEMNWANWQNSIRDPNAPQRDPANQELGRDQFLNLLMTQLRHQDPLDPMDDHAFIAQMAQFSALEQQQQTNLNIQRGQAFGMVGRDVVAEVVNPATNQLQVVTGVAESALIINGEPHVVIATGGFDPETGRPNARQVALSDIRYVGDDATARLLSEISGTLLASQNLSLIGQYAQFVERDGDGNIISFNEGNITSLRFDRELGVVLTVNGQEVTASQVQEISHQPLIIGRTISGGQFMPTEDQVIGNPIHAPVTIQGITINGSDGFILETTGGRILLDDVDNLTAAFRTEGTLFERGDIRGVVQAIHMSQGRPMLQIEGHDELVAFERGTSPSALIGREIVWQRTQHGERYTNEVLRIERDFDSQGRDTGYHRLIINTATPPNPQTAATEEAIFVRNLDMVTQASNQVGRSINGQNITGTRIFNGNAYLLLADDSVLLFTGQTTVAAQPATPSEPPADSAD